MSDVTAVHYTPDDQSTAAKARSAWESRSKAPRSAIELAREVLQGRPSGAVSALALASVAVASAHLNEPEEARAAADQVPQLLAEAGPTDLAEAATVLIETNLARLRAAFLLDDLAEGMRAGQTALELANAHGCAVLEARTHTELGALFGSRQLTSTALKHMQAGVAILEANDLPQSAVLHNNMGNVYLETDRAAEALGFYTRARERFVADGDRFRASLARSNEGRALLALGRVEEGVAALEQGVEWQDGLANRAYFATALSKAALGHVAAGDRARAMSRFEESLEATAMADQSDPFEDEIRAQFGDFLLEEGRPAEALAQFEQALARSRASSRASSEAKLLECTARALAALGRYEDAYKALRAHMEARDKVAGESSELTLRLQLLELEATIGKGNELNLVARQAMLDDNRELRERTRYLEDLSVTDDLTGLFNRRYFRLRVVEEEARAARQATDLVLLLIDVDHFKVVNDTLSHTVGDRVLQEFARLLGTAFRETDVVARWGGEEFAVLLSGFSRQTAQAIAERARQQVQAHDWAQFGPDLALTVSIGISCFSEVAASGAAVGQAGRYDALFDLADARLYEAKRLGRNRVVA